jgi:hypothetical protein
MFGNGAKHLETKIFQLGHGMIIHWNGQTREPVIVRPESSSARIKGAPEVIAQRISQIDFTGVQPERPRCRFPACWFRLGFSERVKNGCQYRLKSNTRRPASLRLLR